MCVVRPGAPLGLKVYKGTKSVIGFCLDCHESSCRYAGEFCQE